MCIGSQKVRWTPDSERLVQGVPWRTSPEDPEQDGMVEVLPPRLDLEEGSAMASESVPRRLYLKKEDFEPGTGHGYSAKCPGCTALMSGKSSQNHSEECRNRMDKALHGSQRSETAKKRTWDFIERTLEEDQKRKKKKELAADGDPTRLPQTRGDTRQTEQSADGDPTRLPQTRGGTQQPDQITTDVGSGTGQLHQVPDLGQPQSAGAGSSHVEANAEGQALGTKPHSAEGVRQGRKNLRVHFQVPVPDQQERAGAGSGSGEASDEQMPKRHRAEYRNGPRR